MSGEGTTVPRAMVEALETLADDDQMGSGATGVLRIVAAWLRVLRVPLPEPLRPEERPAEVQAALLDETVDNMLAQKPGIPGCYHGEKQAEIAYAEGWRDGQAWFARHVRSLPRHPVRG